MSPHHRHFCVGFLGAVLLRFSRRHCGSGVLPAAHHIRCLATTTPNDGNPRRHCPERAIPNNCNIQYSRVVWHEKFLENVYLMYQVVAQ